MSQPKLTQSRRKLLKTIALGGGAVAVGKTLPESWTKPVIDSVMLPAHGVGTTTTTAITQLNFLTAVASWFSDEALATSTYGHIRDWDVSAVTDMGYAFKDRGGFNEDISGWDVSSVANMYWMFPDATSFNQDLSGWCVSAMPSSQPNLFDDGAAAWAGGDATRPQWGTNTGCS